MPKITKFDRTNLKELRAAIDKALAPIAEEYGVSIHAGRATFTEENFKMAIECAIRDASGLALTREAAAFKEFALLLRLTPEHLFREFSYQGRQFRLVGYNPRGSRLPFLIEEMAGPGKGKVLKATHDLVLAGFGIPKPTGTAAADPQA